MQLGNPYNMQQQPYVSWKGPSKSMAVPQKKRPDSNLGHIVNNSFLPANQNLVTIDANAFRARPIKHWRKQLLNSPNEGTMVRNVIYNDAPLSATVIDGSCCATESNTYKIMSNISTLKYNNYMCSDANQCYTVTATDVSNGWNGPIGKRICCNPEANVIKPATTLLSKKYYTDSRAYLRSRGKLYDQKLSGNPYPGVSYFNSAGEIIYPTNANLNTSLRSTVVCSEKCGDLQKTIYKPSNQKFATQGAVSSSSRIIRLKLDTINSNGSSFRSALGAQAANAGRYTGSMTAPYFIKSKIQTCVNYHTNGNKTYCPN